MLKPIALKGARWVFRRGGGGNISSLSDNPLSGIGWRKTAR